MMDRLHKLTSNTNNMEPIDKNKVYSGVHILKIIIQPLKQFISNAFFPGPMVQQNDWLTLKSFMVLDNSNHVVYTEENKVLVFNSVQWGTEFQRNHLESNLEEKGIKSTSYPYESLGLTITS